MVHETECDLLGKSRGHVLDPRHGPVVTGRAVGNQGKAAESLDRHGVLVIVRVHGRPRGHGDAIVDVLMQVFRSRAAVVLGFVALGRTHL